jgi:hypothetical protein
MHADLHPGNFLLLPGGRLGMLDFGAVAATPGGIPAPFGEFAAAVLAGDGSAAVSLARQVGALAPDAEVDPQLILELLHPIAATGAADSFTYSRPWLRRLMAHLAEPRFAPATRKLTPPPEYALVWRATLSAAGLFAQLGATVPTRGLHLAYSPGFRSGIPRRPGRGRRGGIPRQLNGASPGLAHQPPQARSGRPEMQASSLRSGRQGPMVPGRTADDQELRAAAGVAGRLHPSTRPGRRSLA